MATATPAASVAGQNATPATSTAFRSQTQPTIKRPGTVLSGAFGTALPDTQIPPTTLLRNLTLEISATSSGNTATVAFQPDAPLNVLSSVYLHDAQGTAIIGGMNFDSYTMTAANKWFGFSYNSDVTENATYSAVSGSGDDGGSFAFVLKIPVEIVSRTGVGSQINTDTQSPLVLSLAVNSADAVYSTAPTTLPTVNVTVSFGGYWNQTGNPNSFATPSAVGSLNYINWTSYPGLSGQTQFQLANLGLGNSILGMLFINRLASTGARDDTSFPNPFQYAYRGNVEYQYSQMLWKSEMSEATGLTPDTGVYWIDYGRDFINKGGVGNTLFYGALNTAVGDSLEITGNWAAQATLYEVVNYLAVAGSISQIQGR